MATKYRESNHHVIMPIVENIMWIAEYIDGVEFINLLDDFEYKYLYDERGVIETDEYIYIDTMHSLWTHSDGRIMSSKYNTISMDCSDWADYFIFKRNRDREEKMFERVGLSDGDRYIVVSTLCGTPPNSYDMSGGRIPIYNPDNLRIINMTIFENSHLFDWCKIYEFAERIFMVNTSMNYILEKIPVNAVEYVVYAKGHENYLDIEYLFERPDRIEDLGRTR